jgi:hypothetical protein
LLHKDNWLQLEVKVVTINGLDGYALPVLVDRFEYARAGQNKQNHHYKMAHKKSKPTEQNL